MRYVLRPSPEPQKCFLIEALYWAAFQKYPTSDLDIDDENLPQLLEYVDDWDRIRIDDYYMTFFSPEICQKYNFPKNPEYFDIGEEPGSYLDDEDYERMINSGTLTADKIKELKKERVEAKIYHKKLQDFEDALSEYLDIYCAKLYVALREGRIKAKALSGTMQCIYSSETKSLFEKEYEGTEDFEEIKQNIKDGDIFYAYNDKWNESNPEEIPAECWYQDCIDWYNCTLDYKENKYVYIQLDMKDLIKEFPPETAENQKNVMVFGDSFILEDENISIPSKRGRKPKMDYNEISKWYLKNCKKFGRCKKDYVVAKAQEVFPCIGNTTMKNKLYTLIDIFHAGQK